MWFSERRRVKKIAKRLLYDARYVRNMRGEIADPKIVNTLKEAEEGLRDCLKEGSTDAIHANSKTLMIAMEKLAPDRPFRALRENLEIIVVAITVAMAFRTYFIQPFKIPTGSMQPTLYGIHYKPMAEPRLRDRFPLKLVNWLFVGEWYEEVKAQASGVLRTYQIRPNVLNVDIDGVPQTIPARMQMHVERNQTVLQGQRLASGIKLHGDHIFVNKVLWNFRRPKRGEIVVFSTNNIDHPQIKKDTFYIKRMIGLPGDDISIRTPCLYNHGVRIDEPHPYGIGIGRLHNQRKGYERGYLTAPEGAPGALLGAPTDSIPLGPDEFLAFGDNTSSSLDGRYWGAVPRENLVGPAFIVYWPISKRWGRLLR